MKEEFINLINKHGIKNAIILLELPIEGENMRSFYISTKEKEERKIVEELGELLYHNLRLNETFLKIFQVAISKAYNEVSFKSKNFTNFDFLKDLGKK